VSTTDRDTTRIVRSWLDEGATRLPDRVLDAVLDQLPATPQRRATWWPVRRTPTMNKFLAIGLGAAAVVVLLIVGAQLIAAPNTGLGGPTHSARQAEATASVAPSSAGDGSLPVGPHVIDPGRQHGEDRVTVTIPAPGWFAPDAGSLTKDLGGGNRVTVVVVPGDHYTLPYSTCDWQLDDPDVREKYFPNTADEFVAFVAGQTYDQLGGSLTREFTAPEDITIDGSHGQRIVSAVREYPDSDPAACDEQRFCTVQDRDGWGCLLSHPEPGALDTLWVIDPPDTASIYYLVVASTGSPSSALRGEMNAIVDSMTFFDE